jgi:hypothetical protein
MIVGLHRVRIADKISCRRKIANCRDRALVVKAAGGAGWACRAAKTGDLLRRKTNRHASLNCFKLLLAAERNSRREVRDLYVRH